MEQDNDLNVPEEIIVEADDATFSLLPEKSKERYMKELEKFRTWMKTKNVNFVTEEVMVAYFKELIGKYAPPSLWSVFSMLKSTLSIYENIDISKFKIMFALLKSKSKGYQPKKGKTFEYKEVEKFLNEAHDEIYLLMKMVLVMGIMGACRCEELVNLKTTDIEEKGSMLVVSILKTENYKPRSFVVTSVEGQGFNGLGIFRKYTALRPKTLGEGRFFLNYRSGKCTVQPVGINTLAKIPRLVASYLKLEDTHLYTGHCFRRTSAILLSNASADILMLKKHASWHSSNITESFVEESVTNKIRLEVEEDSAENQLSGNEQDIYIKEENCSATQSGDSRASTPGLSSIASLKSITSFKRKRRDRSDEGFDVSSNTLYPQSYMQTETARKYISFGKHIAEELQDLSPEMAIYCKKLINEAIYQAQLGGLTQQSRIVS